MESHHGASGPAVIRRNIPAGIHCHRHLSPVPVVRPVLIVAVFIQIRDPARFRRDGRVILHPIRKEIVEHHMRPSRRDQSLILFLQIVQHTRIVDLIAVISGQIIVHQYPVVIDVIGAFGLFVRPSDLIQPGDGAHGIITDRKPGLLIQIRIESLRLLCRARLFIIFLYPLLVEAIEGSLHRIAVLFYICAAHRAGQVLHLDRRVFVRVFPGSTPAVFQNFGHKLLCGRRLIFTDRFQTDIDINPAAAVKVDGVVLHLNPVGLLSEKIFAEFISKLTGPGIHIARMNQLPALCIFHMCAIRSCKHSVDTHFACDTPVSVKNTAGQISLSHAPKLGFILKNLIFPYIIPVIRLTDLHTGEIIVVSGHGLYFCILLCIQIHKIIRRCKRIPGPRDIIARRITVPALRPVGIGIAVHDAGSRERNLSVVLPILTGTPVCVQPSGVFGSIVPGTGAVLFGDADLISFKMPVVIGINPGGRRRSLHIRGVFLVYRRQCHFQPVLDRRSRSDFCSRISRDDIETAAPGFTVLHSAVQIRYISQVSVRI